MLQQTKILPSTMQHNFAFIVHPRDIGDIREKYPIIKVFPIFFVEFFLNNFFPPIIVSKITGVKDKKTKQPITGWIISIPMTARQMMNDRIKAKKHIIRAVKLAEKKGVCFIGLGALTASLTHGGLDLLTKINKDIILTSGKLYTAKTVSDIAEKSAEVLNLDREKIKLAIVGAGGSIGSASAQILVKKGFKKFALIDLSHQQKRIGDISNLLIKLGGSDIVVTKHKDLTILKEADIIIAATNRPDALIRSEHLKPGAVVVDDAQPSDVDLEILKTRKDVLILEGGVVHTNGVRMNFRMGLHDREDIFSCLAETIIYTYLKEKESFVGDILEVDFDKLKKLEEQARLLGFIHGEFQNVEKLYSQDDIERVKRSRV